MSRLSGNRAHKRKQQRLVMGLAGLFGLAIAGALLVLALGEGANHFRTPADLAERPIEPGRSFRLGGLVAEGSVDKLGDSTITFRVTDGAAEQLVRFRGIVPDLFREGQGVIAEGVLDSAGLFVASNVLAKHDETYMPPEVAEALKERGEWREGADGKLVPVNSAEPGS
ncbi:cytochrome c-type biogenesis protein CcmE [Rhodothalassium salexigens DSM 2132]|uniref:Cytochrome c-type biogenesis protein CcmE n=1 Tax=Rhodothalassium salexigens DSM 2132 TaxID=1188247 RepID=A0A4R2PBM2_RHOSA|nr:cytochrome c maturation protein CcmE [Rhodothalassium salexigens]MBB4212330.1 cytochrome c-type biogenesis protein CcmE [Rhodothalassium salexigens DSM 2132]MBK1638830.1 cytochrome c biogenesis protein CcmE [Rhodothalassium salexigens DSM 2132]TCP32519.1 cytochrome c-type biogenesis protein CcmE [Rhodothalassium salexigens DSM 2132]